MRICKKPLILFSLFALCAVLITSCSDDLISKYNSLPLDIPHGMGYLSISIEGDGARANVPNKPVPDSYKLVFTPVPGGTAIEINRLSSEISSPLYLVPGEYALSVEAFVSGALVARGNPASNVIITAGSGTNCTVTLKAIIGTAGTQGTFNWNISFPSDVASAQMTVKPVNVSHDLKTTGTGNMTLNTGYYNIEIVLERANAKTIKHMEIIHIYENLVTSFVFAFTEDHFNITSYTLFLYYNDGVTPTLSQSIYHGGKYTKPLDPVITPGAGLYLGTPFYTFEGWYLDGFDNVPWNFNDYTFIGDTSLNARWSTTNVDLTSSSGGNYIEKAFNYANANASAGAYTLLVGSNESSATISVTASAFNLTIRAVDGASTYELNGMISVVNGRLMLGSNIYIPPSSDNFLIVSPNASLIMSGNAQAGIIVLDSIDTNTAFVSVSENFSGEAGINLRGSGNIDALRTLWNNKPVIKGLNDYSLTGYDVGRFALRDFIPAIGLTTAAITATHLLELDSGANAIVLREKPKVTVSANGGAAVNYSNLTEALASITAAGNYTVRLYENQQIAPRTITRNITLIAGDSAVPVSINLSSNGSMFTVSNGAVLTLDNGIALNGRNSNNASLVTVNTTGILNMKAGSKIRVNYNTSGDGGGVSLIGGTMNMETGSEIIGNTAGDFGGGVFVNGGLLNMNGGSISTNSAFYGGGGIFVENNGKLIMESDSIISDNEASMAGGVFIEDSVFQMKGGSIVNNIALDYSAGVDVFNSNFIIGGNAIIKNNKIYGTNSNLVLDISQFITLGNGASDVPAPQAGMEVWVQTTRSDGVIVNSGAAASHAQYFRADENGGVIAHEGVQLKIVN